MQEYAYRIEDTWRRVRRLRAALEQWERRAEDLPRLADAVFSAGDGVAELRKRVVPKLAHIRDVGLRCRIILEVNPVSLFEKHYLCSCNH